MARNGRLSYGADSDLDPNIIALINRKIETQVETLIDDRVQRRQVWGPTFKQEGIANLTMTDADYIVPSPEYGKRTLVFAGALTAARIVRLPPIPTAWWIVRNNSPHPLTMLIWPTGTEGPTVAPGNVEIVYTDGVVVWRLTGPEGGTGPGGDGTPGGTPTQLQYKVDSTTFGGVAGSSVSLANVGLGGTLNIAVTPKSILLDPVSQDFPYIQFDRGGADLLNANSGAIVFRGMRGGTPTQTGYLRSFYNEFFGLTMEMGIESGTTRIAVEETATVKAVTMNTPSHYWQVEHGGLRTSEGAGGAMLYQDGPVGYLYLKPLEIGLLGQVLKVTDIGGGVLRPRWGVATSGGGVPEGITTELQSRDPGGTAFKRVANSSVSGADVVLGGELAFHNVLSTDQHIRMSAIGTDPAILMAKFGPTPPGGGPLIFMRRGRGTHSLPAAIESGDHIGAMLFQGYNGTDWSTHGYWRSFIDSAGSITQLGAGPYDQAFVQVTYNASAASAGLQAGTGEWRVQTDGLISSYGLTGSMLYKAPGGSPTTPSTWYMWDLPIGVPGEALTVAESTHPTYGLYRHPKWAPLTASSLRLDQVLSPLNNTDWNMAGWQVRHRYDGPVPWAGVLIDSTNNAANQGILLYIRNTYTDDNAARLLVCQINNEVDFPLCVTHIGAVGMGGVPNPGPTIPETFRCQIFTAGASQNALYVAGRVEFTGGINWGVYYRDGVNQHIVTTAPAPGYLKSTGAAAPFFTSINMATDVSGILPVDKGGTGLGTPPGAGQILIGNGTVYGLGTITNGGGISVAYTGGNIQLTATGGSVNDSLDTILDPAANAELDMGPGYRVRFKWPGAVPDLTFGGGFLIDSTTNAASQGVLLHIRNTYTDDNAARLLVCQINTATDYPLCVSHIGAVGMGGAPNPGLTIPETFRLQVFTAGAAQNGLYVAGRVEFTGGTNWGVYYRDGVQQNIVTTAAAAGFLKSTGSAAPFFTGISMTDVSGVLPISKGGTGIGTAPGPGYLLIGKADGSYIPAILSEDTGILITEGDGTITIKCTVTPGTGATPPGGSATNIQFNDSGAFGGLAYSGVDVSANGLFLGGYLQLKDVTSLDQEFAIAATSSFDSTRFKMRMFRSDPARPQYFVFERSRGSAAAKSTLTTADGVIAQMIFNGYIGSPLTNTQLGFLQTSYETGYGGVVTLASRDAAYAKLSMQDNYAVNGLASITLHAEPQFFQVQTGGFRISIGAVGAIYYQSYSGSETRLTYLNSSTESAGYVLTLVAGVATEAGSLVPRWQAPTGGPGGSTPGTPNLSLQYNNGSTFAGIDGVKVVSAGSPNLMFGGYLQLVAGWTQATSIADIDQEFFISATKAAPTRFVMRCFRGTTAQGAGVNADGPYILFERARGTQSAQQVMLGGDEAGLITFKGNIGEGGMTQLGYIQAYWSASNVGAVVRLAARNAGARLEITDNTPVNGITTITLLATSHFFQVQNSGFRISIGSVGAIYYQSNSGAQTALTHLDSSTGLNGYVLTLIPGFATEAGSLVPRWQAPPAGGPGGSPGSPVNSLQWNSASSFAGVANSSVTTGGLVTLGEQSGTLDNAVLTLQKAGAAGANLTNGHSVGKIAFKGMLGGVQSDFGILEALYNSTPLRTLRLGQGIGAGAYRVIALKDSGEIGIEVSNGSQISIIKVQGPGITLTPGAGAGTNYGTYVRDGSGYIVTVGPGSVGTYLRSSTTSAVPSWQTLSFGDFTSGTLPIARGGTNLGTTPGSGYLLIGNGSGYSLNQLVGAGGITISYPTAGNITITQTAGSSPAGQLRGSKALSNNTLTSLFQVDFSGAPFTQAGCGGIIDLVFEAKHSGHIYVMKRKVSFIIGHNNSSNDSVAQFVENANDRAGGATDDNGLSAISHAINSDGAVGIGTPVPSNPNAVVANSVIYRVLAASPLSSPSITVYYTIIYHGDATITLL